MDAITLLEQQHEEIEALFSETQRAYTPEQTVHRFEQLADALAVHATLEEQVFYPAIQLADFDPILLEALEQHLAAKRVIADLLALPPTDEHYHAKLTVLRDEVLHHIRVERAQILPRARRQLSREEMDRLGSHLERLGAELSMGSEAPRWQIPSQTKHVPPLH